MYLDFKSFYLNMFLYQFFLHLIFRRKMHASACDKLTLVLRCAREFASQIIRFAHKVVFYLYCFAQFTLFTILAHNDHIL